ncbi:MAG: hypothetical protein IJT87_01390 [Ruminiclostridium sp.]|nr:hypothetical protein [Ruminiclostridium sp.]
MIGRRIIAEAAGKAFIYDFAVWCERTGNKLIKGSCLCASRHTVQQLPGGITVSETRRREYL